MVGEETGKSVSAEADEFEIMMNSAPRMKTAAEDVINLESSKDFQVVRPSPKDQAMPNAGKKADA